MDPQPAERAGTHAIIDTNAFRHNLDEVRSYVGPAVKILAVVKANAYGHGGVELARVAQAWGAEYLGVARVQEALELRAAGVAGRILVFESAPEECFDAALRNEVALTIVSVESARALDRLARSTGVQATVHVKVDTGMGRLGMAHEEAPERIEECARLSGLRMEGVYSHFATAEETDQSYAHAQLARFLRVVEAAEARGIRFPLRHMANSGAIMTLPESHLDMVRPGIMLYGYTPGEGMPGGKRLRPVMSLLSRVAFMKSVGPGTSISYNRRYRTAGPTRIATVPVGYADGYSRLLTNRTSAIIGGKRYPVVGTVTMDNIMVDLGPESPVEQGDPVTLIGSDGAESITAWDIASTLGSIPYEITCLITRRVPRVFV